MAGDVMNSLQGGKFGHGFVSAGFSEAASPIVASRGGPISQGTAAAVIGGTASAMTGGKFANGAMTAAMSYAFGEMATRRSDSVTVTGAGSDVVAEASAGGQDVVGTPETDAAFVRQFGSMPRDVPREQGFGYLPDGRFTRPYWISEDGGSFLVPSNAIAIGHTHVKGSWQVTILREWPGPGDHLAVEGGRPNYFRTPSGAIRVVERVGGEFRLRTVAGRPYLDSQWRVGTEIEITSRMQRCQCFR